MIDVVIPTQFSRDRLKNLICQIKVSLNQEVSARVVLVCSVENWHAFGGDVMRELTEKEWANIKIFTHPDGKKGDAFDTPDGYMCNPALLAYLESDIPCEWQLHSCDDDSLTPWALRHLLEASDGQAMVVGRSIAVDRNHGDRREYLLGNDIERCHVALSSCLIKTECVRALDKPWFNVKTGYADWELIERLSKRFSYRMIPQIVNVNALSL